MSATAGAGGSQPDMVLVTQVRSAFGQKPKTRGTIRALGLKGPDSWRLHEDSPTLQGMLAKVPHLVRVETRGSGFLKFLTPRLPTQMAEDGETRQYRVDDNVKGELRLTPRGQVYRVEHRSDSLVVGWRPLETLGIGALLARLHNLPGAREIVVIKAGQVVLEGPWRSGLPQVLLESARRVDLLRISSNDALLTWERSSTTAPTGEIALLFKPPDKSKLAQIVSDTAPRAVAEPLIDILSKGA